MAVSSAQADFSIDLTKKDNSGNSGTGIFQEAQFQPTGTGVFDPFVRIQQTGTEAGYNTDGRPVEFQTKDENHWTHSLALSSLGVVTRDGVDYFQFRLDINEIGSEESQNHPEGRHLSMNDFEIYLGNAPDLLGLTPGSGFGGNSVLVYDIDTADARGDATVELNDKPGNPRHPGSGDSDMDVFIKVSDFQGKDPSLQWVYLYSKFGVPHPSDDGFEEWSAFQGEGPTPPTPPPPAIPAPASALLLLTGLPGLTMAWYRRRRAAQA
ncbi:MAG TPA: hypothetical protein VFG68_09005 [Fimbriiglobus sp.]|nr:hypothetical protein [Fimbriiglobus sp.]